MEISLCMIVKNEGDVIRRCLESVKDVVDEIIIVDTGSTDNTIKEAEDLGAKVYNFEWVNDFGKARNYSFSKATKDYILWLDADDILNPTDIEAFKAIKQSLDGTVDSYTMNYVLTIGANGQFLNTIRRNRLVKRERNFRWIGQVHEYLEVYGNILNLNINIIHKKEKAYSNRNLAIYKSIIESGKELPPRDVYYFANELYDNQLYDEAIDYYSRFIDSKLGWVEDIKRACLRLSECYSYKGDKDSELKALLSALEYDAPSAELCCKLGYFFKNKDNNDMALFWFKLATSATPKPGFMAISNSDSYGYIPWIELCVCYSKKGDYKTAYICNEMANKFKPDNAGVIHNRNFLKDKVDVSELIIGNPYITTLVK